MKYNKNLNNFGILCGICSQKFSLKIILVGLDTIKHSDGPLCVNAIDLSNCCKLMEVFYFFICVFLSPFIC
jgi:hypothetical protein